MTTGILIKKFRKLKGLTQIQLAEMIGISKNGLWNYENDKRNINLETLQKIAEALDVTINDLMGNSEKTVIIQNENIISNSLVMESTYRLLEEVLKHHDELPNLMLTADEIINADNCYWELLVPDVINTIKNSVSRFTMREDRGKLKPREKEEEVMIKLGKLVTINSNELDTGKIEFDTPRGLNLIENNKSREKPKYLLIPLSKMDTNKKYLEFKLEGIKKKLDALNSTEKEISNDLPEK